MDNLGAESLGEGVRQGACAERNFFAGEWLGSIGCNIGSGGAGLGCSTLSVVYVRFNCAPCPAPNPPESKERKKPNNLFVFFCQCG